MSVAAITWVLEHSEAELGARLVMIAIADAANSEGRNAWPSIATIARHSRLSERNVKRILPRLEQSGELGIERNRGPYGVHVYNLPLVTRSQGTVQSETTRPPRGKSASSARPGPTPLATQGGDKLSPPGVTNRTEGGDKSSTQGVTQRHPNQELKQKPDPSSTTPLPPLQGVLGVDSGCSDCGGTGEKAVAGPGGWTTQYEPCACLAKSPEGLFRMVWNEYPRPQNWERAFRRFLGFAPTLQLTHQIIRGIRAYRQTDQWLQGRIPFLDKFLRRRQWLDGLPYRERVPAKG